MNSLRITSVRPKQKDLLAASIRVSELEEFVLRLLDHQSHEDRLCLRAMVTIASNRFIELLNSVNGPIYGYAMNEEDHAILDWCRKSEPDEWVLAEAQSGINIMDSRNLYGGQPNIDEVALALLNAARHVFQGAWR